MLYFLANCHNLESLSIGFRTSCISNFDVKSQSLRSLDLSRLSKSAFLRSIDCPSLERLYVTLSGPVAFGIEIADRPIGGGAKSMEQYKEELQRDLDELPQSDVIRRMIILLDHEFWVPVNVKSVGHDFKIKVVNINHHFYDKPRILSNEAAYS